MTTISLKNPVITPEKGTAYLQSSHFTVAQDANLQPQGFHSTFRHDYPPHFVDARPVGAKGPAPASFLHSDARFFNNKASETTKEFQPHEIGPRLKSNNRGASGQTNFKMDRDLKKFDSFMTTHNHYFPAKDNVPFERFVPSEYPLASHIPDGDKEKAPQPMSDYRSKYQGHDTEKHKIEKAPNQHHFGDATIKGDQRTHTYSTHTMETHHGAWLPRIHELPKPVGTNVPLGDREKEITLKTTMQADFKETDSGSLVPYDRTKSIGQQGTNFKLRDGHGTWQTYLSTAKESWVNKDFTEPAWQLGKHRNASDFPVGDNDPVRNCDRASLTTNRHYEAQKLTHLPENKLPDKHKYRNNIISGANLRTRSNVWFGDPVLNKDYYSTHNEDIHAPKYVPYSYNKGIANPNKSVIPLDYYPHEKKHSMTWQDFQNPRQGATIPNPSCINKLKETHIVPPLGGERHFSTTHVEHYTPKHVSKTFADSGRLQRSSVPLGTLQI